MIKDFGNKYRILKKAMINDILDMFINYIQYKI